MLFHLMTNSLCLVPVDDSVLVLIGMVQTDSIAHSIFCHSVVNRHTIIKSHRASSSSALLETLYVPIRIIMSGILPGFIKSTIYNNWAIVAPPKTITVVIHEVLKFCRTLTRLSVNIKCDVPSGGCCKFLAGLHVDRLKHARLSVCGTPVKLFLIRLKFFFLGIRKSTRNLSQSFWPPVVQQFL